MKTIAISIDESTLERERARVGRSGSGKRTRAGSRGSKPPTLSFSFERHCAESFAQATAQRFAPTPPNGMSWIPTPSLVSLINAPRTVSSLAYPAPRARTSNRPPHFSTLYFCR